MNPLLRPPVPVEDLPRTAATDALEEVLRAGFDPEHDPERLRADVGSGDLLTMPSVLPDAAGVKIVSVTAAPAPGHPAIQGVYVLFDAATLAPVALLDGATLTAWRTPAVSMLAVRHLLARPLETALVLGTGVQAFHHALALDAEARRAGELRRLVVAGRDGDRVAALVARLRAHDVPADAGTVADVAHADVTVSATSAGVPLFDGRRVGDGAVVVAIGSHSATTRDVDGALLARSVVVVESRRSAGREAGAVLTAAASGAIGAVDTLPNLADLVAGRVARDPARPRVFVGTGMSWQDLAVARAAVRWARDR